jgi:hypothetical protein
MPTLNYASSGNEQTSVARNVGVFLPAVVATATYYLACVWLPYADIVNLFLLATVVIADIITVVLLSVWRRRLNLVVMVAGWLIVGLGAAFLGFVAAVNHGILPE